MPSVSLLIALLLTSGAEAPTSANPGSFLEVRLEVPPQWAPRRTVTIIATARGHGEEPPLELRATTPNRLELPVGTAWSVTCSGEGVWCPTLQIALQDPPSRVDLPCFPAARLTGRPLVPRGAKGPETILVQGWFYPQAAEKPITLLLSAAVVGSSFEIEVPQGRLDLRLAAEGWAPVYRWGVEIGQGGLDLGALDLIPGGSISGFVVGGDGVSPVPGAELSLVPAGSRSPPGGAPTEHLALLATTTRSSHLGFFQVAGLQAGRYHLEVRSSTFAPTRVEDVEVLPAAETLLTRIQLKNRIRVSVSVDPPLDPEDRLWLLRFIPRHPLNREILEIRTDEQGQATPEGLSPESYTIWLMTAAGSLVDQKQVALDQDDSVAFSLPLVRVLGEVRVGDQPVAAAVELSTGEGDSWRFASDAEGVFRGTMRLPTRILFARVRAAEPQLEADLEIREFLIREGLLELEIELSDLAIRGFVLDQTAAPVARATVEARSDRSRAVSSTRSDQDGRFTLPGLQAGAYRVAASHPDRGDSAPERVVLGPQASATALTLVLRRRSEVSGIVQSASGQPVPGAQVRVSTPRPIPLVDAATTDASGRFSLRLPAEAAYGVVEVLAPSQLAWSGCVMWAPDPEAEVRIELPPLPGGEIEVLTTWDPQLAPTTSGWAFLLTGDGGFLAADTLADWTDQIAGALPPEVDRARGTVRAFYPAVASGTYAYVFSQDPWWVWADRLCTRALAPNLDWKYLSPGGQIRFEHDHRPHQRALE